MAPGSAGLALCPRATTPAPARRQRGLSARHGDLIYEQSWLLSPASQRSGPSFADSWSPPLPCHSRCFAGGCVTLRAAPKPRHRTVSLPANRQLSSVRLTVALPPAPGHTAKKRRRGREVQFLVKTLEDQRKSTIKNVPFLQCMEIRTFVPGTHTVAGKHAHFCAWTPEARGARLALGLWTDCRPLGQLSSRSKAEASEGLVGRWYPCLLGLPLQGAQGQASPGYSQHPVTWAPGAGHRAGTRLPSPAAPAPSLQSEEEDRGREEGGKKGGRAKKVGKSKDHFLPNPSKRPLPSSRAQAERPPSWAHGKGHGKQQRVSPHGDRTPRQRSHGPGEAQEPLPRASHCSWGPWEGERGQEWSRGCEEQLWAPQGEGPAWFLWGLAAVTEGQCAP